MQELPRRLFRHSSLSASRAKGQGPQRTQSAVKVGFKFSSKKFLKMSLPSVRDRGFTTRCHLNFRNKTAPGLRVQQGPHKRPMTRESARHVTAAALSRSLLTRLQTVCMRANHGILLYMGCATGVFNAQPRTRTPSAAAAA